MQPHLDFAFQKNWVTQQLVRFGNIESIDSDDIFNRSKMQSLTMGQVVWWKETHRKCVIGRMGRLLGYCIKFSRDEPVKSTLKMKAILPTHTQR